MLLVALIDLLICFRGHLNGGSNPSERKGIMVSLHKAGQVTGRFIESAHKFLSRWVVRAALLALGIGCAFPRPHAHSL